MNSADKLREILEEKANKELEVLEQKNKLAKKIFDVRMGYVMRCHSSTYEINDLKDVLSTMHQDSPDRDRVVARIKVLKEDKEFCNRQILAYTTNDNKNKIIPDRLL